MLILRTNLKKNLIITNANIEIENFLNIEK